MGPPGLAPSRSSSYVPEEDITADAAVAMPRTITEFLAAAARYCDASGLPFRHRRMVAVGHRYLERPASQRGLTPETYLRITYLDPTGETAVRNVRSGGACR